MVNSVLSSTVKRGGFLEFPKTMVNGDAGRSLGDDLTSERRESHPAIRKRASLLLDGGGSGWWCARRGEADVQVAASLWFYPDAPATPPSRPSSVEEEGERMIDRRR